MLASAPGVRRAQVVAPQRRPVRRRSSRWWSRRRRRPGYRQSPVTPGMHVQRPQRHPAAGVALDAHRRADAGRARVGEPPAELDDRARRGRPADLGDALRRELEDALAERLPAERVARDVVAVLARPRRARRAAARARARRRCPGSGARCSSAWLGRARAQRVDRRPRGRRPAWPRDRTSTGGGRW